MLRYGAQVKSHHWTATFARFDTVIGHSYGSTLVGGAAGGGNHLAADNVIAVASPVLACPSLPTWVEAPP